MGQPTWVIDVNRKHETMPDTNAEKEHWMKRSIYKLPAALADLNKKAYTPQVVSFGPYHHGKDRLIPMEEHKKRSLLHFLKRSDKPLEAFVNSLVKDVEKLKECYDLLDPIWEHDDHKFLQMMILDGCFMLEILRSATHTMEDYAPNDPFFSHHGKIHIMPFIKRDMLMLENQLPMHVLHSLVADGEFLNKLILKFCSPNTPISTMGTCLHVLDVYRKSLLPDIPRRRNENDVINRALYGTKMATTSFDQRWNLTKPESCSRKANPCASRTFNSGEGFSRYQSSSWTTQRSLWDVALLHSRGIIQNALGSDKAVANLFNSLSKDISLDPDSSLDEVHKKVNKYCKKAWNEWRANLIHTYFRNLWAILSLIGAIFLFALPISQTVYTIYPYYQDSPNPPPPSMAPPPLPPPPTAAPPLSQPPTAVPPLSQPPTAPPTPAPKHKAPSHH
ncbi:heparan-alpha-glucosaminide N-acetyltransferase-like [Hibiscus syriacus]|uniref:Heparan-alpha-glucosaminide N-acetyltransferase-like n=1 Tax=Hibiscus syriacus TaxID=106335 RepID=A0A6A2WRN8_HIBSY|nr:heparan-alpha-glucosaminide N-acetyltransferase-like [Hibiscus syriacus]